MYIVHTCIRIRFLIWAWKSWSLLRWGKINTVCSRKWKNDISLGKGITHTTPSFHRNRVNVHTERKRCMWRGISTELGSLTVSVLILMCHMPPNVKQESLKKALRITIEVVYWIIMIFLGFSDDRSSKHFIGVHLEGFLFSEILRFCILQFLIFILVLLCIMHVTLRTIFISDGKAAITMYF